MICRATGFRGWNSPKNFRGLRWWALWAWNEYDDWLFDGIHGFRILGFEFSAEPKWLDKLCWKVLPLIRRYVVHRLPVIPY
jgi:hypothetical protein